MKMHILYYFLFKTDIEGTSYSDATVLLLFNGAVMDSYSASDNGTQQITLNYTDINNNQPDKGFFKLSLQHEQYGCISESEEEKRDCKYTNIVFLLIFHLCPSISSSSYQYYCSKCPS